jgi:hypothetical protein
MTSSSELVEVAEEQHECEEQYCTSVDTLQCREPYSDEEPAPATPTFVWYCTTHAIKNGFCGMCGEFWGGTESFEFGRHKGYCSDCADELERPDEDEDYDDYGYYYD